MRKIILSIFCIGLAGCGGSNNTTATPNNTKGQPTMVFGEGKLNESELG